MIKSSLKHALSLLPESARYEVFYQMARSLGVQGYVASGAAGQFVGALSDQSVIRPYLRDKTWSSNIVAILTRFFETYGGGVFLDVGANIGLVTVPVSQLPGVSCIAFEPDAENYGMLKANVARNTNAAKVQIINAGVANKSGQMRFTRSAFNSGDHRLSTEGDHVVNVTTLDVLDRPAGPFAVKIDTQGAEPLIFAGGEQTLRAAGLIIAEFWPWAMKRMSVSPDAIVNFVRANHKSGYLLKHDANPDGVLLSSEALVSAMQAIIADAGEFAQADLVLIGTPFLESLALNDLGPPSAAH